MFQKKNPVILFSLCAALAACDVGPTRDPMAPEEPGAGPRGARSMSVLAPSNTWTAKRAMPTARTAHKAGTLNNIIYVVGGRTPTAVLSRVEAYHVATNTWSRRQSLPSALVYVNGVSPIGGMLYVTGGSHKVLGPTKALYVYNPATNTWVRKANMPETGGCGAQGVIAGLLYVYNGCGSGEGQFYRYNPATDTWITLAPAPGGKLHEGGEGAVIGGKFYLAGGVVIDDWNQLHVYNPATNTWTTRAPMPEGASHPASAVLKGKLFVAGGFAFDALTTLRVYSPGSNTWTTKAPLPTPRWNGAGAVAGGLFFVIGGSHDQYSTPTGKVVAYTP
jgi:N-acetylneuraminic acid mutarotase